MDMTGKTGLTSSPIIAYDVSIGDNCEYETTEETKLYWYPNYMIVDPMEDLYKKGVVFFEQAEKED